MGMEFFKQDYYKFDIEAAMFWVANCVVEESLLIFYDAVTKFLGWKAVILGCDQNSGIPSQWKQYQSVFPCLI